MKQIDGHMIENRIRQESEWRVKRGGSLLSRAALFALIKEREAGRGYSVRRPGLPCRFQTIELSAARIR